MLNYDDFLDKFITSKNLYEIILGDRFVDNYLYDSNDLRIIQLMEMRGMRGVSILKKNLIPIKERIEEFPLKVNGVYNEINNNTQQINSESSKV